MTEPTDAELIALLGDRQFSSIGAVREALRRWGTPPAVAGEPVAWLSTDCIGERYLCFTKPKDSNPARPLVFGDTTPHPTQAQAGAVPLTDDEALDAAWTKARSKNGPQWVPYFEALRAVAALARKDDDALIRQMLEALEYHRAQTRPIDRTDDAITAGRARLEGKP